MSQPYDAITIGGGPAGALSARLLAMRGWRVLLVDRRKPGAGKTCGHCLHPRALGPLRRAGVRDATLRISRGVTQSFHLHLDENHTFSMPLFGRDENGSSGLLVERRRFDQMLLGAAAESGVEIVHPAVAHLITRERDVCFVEVRFRNEQWLAHAPLVIGANGLHSSVAQQAGLQRPTARSRGTKFGVSFSVTSHRAALIAPGCIEMFVLKDGYLGAVNMGRDQLHIAILIDGESPHQPRSPRDIARTFAERFPRLERIGLGSLAARDLQHSFGTAPMPSRPRAVANNRIALVGDAAGYVEPFTGEGMTWAIDSADALAQALADAAPGEWTPIHTGRYRALWQKRIGAHQRRCRLIAWLVARPALLRVCCRFAEMQPRLSRPVIERMVPA